jgi:hypothetical protein
MINSPRPLALPAQALAHGCPLLCMKTPVKHLKPCVILFSVMFPITYWGVKESVFLTVYCYGDEIKKR